MCSQDITNQHLIVQSHFLAGTWLSVIPSSRWPTGTFAAFQLNHLRLFLFFSPKKCCWLSITTIDKVSYRADPAGAVKNIQFMSTAVINAILSQLANSLFVTYYLSSFFQHCCDMKSLMETKYEHVWPLLRKRKYPERKVWWQTVEIWIWFSKFEFPIRETGDEYTR